MGDRSAHDPARPARRGQTVGERARGSERDLLRAVDRLPMEGAAQGSAAEGHGARLELWNWDGTLERIHHALYMAQREEEGREASPTVGPARLRCLLFLLCASLGRGTRGRNRRSEGIVRQPVPDLAAAEQ